MKPITIPFRCDALLDQGRYIGPDPVGHKCSGEAAWELYDTNGPLLCGHCRSLWLDPTERHRITFGRCYGKAYQENQITMMMKSFDDLGKKPTQDGEQE